MITLLNILVTVVLRLAELFVLAGAGFFALLGLRERRPRRRRVSLMGTWLCLSLVIIIELVLMVVRLV
jgi:hypothetical protein